MDSRSAFSVRVGSPDLLFGEAAGDGIVVQFAEGVLADPAGRGNVGGGEFLGEGDGGGVQALLRLPTERRAQLTASFTQWRSSPACFSISFEALGERFVRRTSCRGR